MNSKFDFYHHGPFYGLEGELWNGYFRTAAWCAEEENSSSLDKPDLADQPGKRSWWLYTIIVWLLVWAAAVIAGVSLSL